MSDLLVRHFASPRSFKHNVVANKKGPSEDGPFFDYRELTFGNYRTEIG